MVKPTKITINNCFKQVRKYFFNKIETVKFSLLKFIVTQRLMCQINCLILQTSLPLNCKYVPIESRYNRSAIYHSYMYILIRN